MRARTLTPDDALLEYLDDHGMRRISQRLSRSGALDVVATAVPGMSDILVLGKVKQLERAGAADLIILDAPAAGHAVSFLLSARGLLDAVTRRSDPQARRPTWSSSSATRPAARCMLVTLPEETPVNELVDTAYAVEDRAGVALGPIVGERLRAAARPRRRRRSVTNDGVRADAVAVGLTLDDGEVRALADGGRVPRRSRSTASRPVRAARRAAPAPAAPAAVPLHRRRRAGRDRDRSPTSSTAGIASLEDVAAR